MPLRKGDLGTWDSPVPLVLMEREGHEEGENSLHVKDSFSV